MAVKLNRSDRQASLYVPRDGHHRICAALLEAGWEAQGENWNSEQALVRVRIPAAQGDSAFVAALGAAFPDEDFEVDVEDHYYEDEA